MNNTNIYVVILIFCVASNAIAQESIPKLHQYQNDRTYSLADERYNLALSYVKNSVDTAATGEALKDLVKYAKAFEKDTEALAEVETLISNTQPGTELYGRANLAKARFLMRLGQKDDAMNLFHQGVINRWGDNAFWEINDAFLETDRHAALAIDEYHRNATDNYDIATRNHYGIGGDLSVFFLRLREAKLKNPDLSAMNDIFIYLEPSSWRPHVLDIAKAICLAFDRRTDEALKLLDEIEANVRRQDQSKNQHEEWKYLPFCRAQILFLHTEDYDKARAAMQEYINRNPADVNLIINRSLEYIHSIMEDERDRKKIAEITSFLIESDFVTNDEYKQQIPEHKFASIYDKHQNSLSWRGNPGDREEAKQMCKFVMDNYYPHTLAGANCAMCYGIFLYSDDKQYKEAEDLFHDILLNAPYDSIVPWVKYSLADIELKKGNTDQAIILLDEVILLTKGTSISILQKCHEDAVMKKNSLMN